jgi:transposase
VDARGVPLSFIVTGAQRHDVSQLEPVLAAMMVHKPSPPMRRHKHLCADAAYGGKPALSLMERKGYIAHVKSRQQEVVDRKRAARNKPRRWVVEVAHSWFNRFRKLQVRYEKLARSFRALNQLAAAIIVLRKVPMTINIIYG